MHQNVIDFWFDEIDPVSWWKKDPEFDRLIEDRFSSLHLQAACCELYTWRTSALGALAEVIILDQFSRNMYRDTAASFRFDSLALALSQSAIAAGYDQQLSLSMRKFLYMPFMHSESALIHEQAVKLYKTLGDENTLEFEQRHKKIIDQFGRYPHRNKILGRESSSAEIEFLQLPGSGF